MFVRDLASYNVHVCMYLCILCRDKGSSFAFTKQDVTSISLQTKNSQLIHWNTEYSYQ
jgi:hypothetical protein